MASGGRRIKTNLRERPVSGDLNRQIAFASGDLAEVLRYLLDARVVIDAGGGVEDASQSTTPTLPGRALILAGLRCDPQAGLTDLLVTPGVALLGAVDASPDADDSPFKFVVDPGVQALGSLNLTPNASGSARVDVVECQPVDQLLTSEVRDVFDLPTGVFPPGGTLVEKVLARRLSYRIRVGTPAAGFPGTAAGWLPLMVVCAPNGAVVWDDCVLWDVRPLRADLVHPAAGQRAGKRAVGAHWVTTEIVPSPPSVPATSVLLRGRVETHGSLRFVAGGDLDDQVGGSIDLLDAACQDATATPFVADRPWHLWVAFPFSLPRWCRYDASLVPGTLRGIPLVSRTGPASELGTPSATVLPPAALGLGAGAATTDAALLVAGQTGAATNRVWAVEANGPATIHVVYGAGTNVAPSATTADTATWTLTDGTHVPANARAVHCVFSGSVTGMTVAGTTLRRITLRDLGDVYNLWNYDAGSVPHAAADPAAFTEVFGPVRVPVQASPDNLGLHARKVKWTHNYSAQTGGALGSPLLTIVGWELVD